MEIDPETRELLTPNIRTEAFYDLEADVALLVDYVDDGIVRQQAWGPKKDGTATFFELQTDQWAPIHEAPAPEVQEQTAPYIKSEVIDEEARIYDLTWENEDGLEARADITFDEEWRIVQLDLRSEGPDGTLSMSRTTMDRFNEDFDMPELP